MAVIIGDIDRSIESGSRRAKHYRWLVQQVGKMVSRRANPSAFPERVWQRHSALLDAGWKSRRNGC